MAEKLGVPLIGQIPLVADVCTAGDKGCPVAIQTPKPGGELTPDAVAFTRLAENVVKAVDERNRTLPPTHKVEMQH